MGRWEPGSRGRLAQAALRLYAEQGFDRTTAADVARAAGLQERSFFRYFTDKAEAFFAGVDDAAAELATAIRSAEAPPVAALIDALGERCDLIEHGAEYGRARRTVITANPVLAERDLLKHEETARTAADALIERGIDAERAQITATIAVTVFRLTTAQWLERPVGSLRAQFTANLPPLGE